MANRYLPSEEYRKRLRDRHILEGFCLVNAAVILVLGIVFLLDIDRRMWVPETIAVLGGILNYLLAVRGVLVRSWIQTVGLLAAGSACFGLLAWLNWT